MQPPKSRHPRRALCLPVTILPMLLGGCDMVVMNPTGDIAMQQRNLILLSLGLMLLIIVPVIALTVVFAWKYRRGNPNKDYDPDFHHSTTLELVIWACPLAIITVLGAVTWTSTHQLDPFRPLERIAPGKPIPAGTKPLNVQVVALDWKWLFIYPDLGIATVNELALPVDVPVRFSITSTDQFNTFSAPTLAGMIYAMPTMRSELNAVLNKTGDSWGYSGNYTGAGYSDMRFKLRGVTKAGFENWVAEAKAKGTPLSTQTYLALAKPSQKAPVVRYSSVQAGLFDRIVNACAEPGKPCMIDVMRRDMLAGKMHMGERAATCDDKDGKLAPKAADAQPEKQAEPAVSRDPKISGIDVFPFPGAPRAERA